jgi:Bifunctional DNA primase/polymerase, N-terminal
MTALLQAALGYACAGMPVFPLIPGTKEPAIKGGFHTATLNPAAITRLWRIGDRNIGIRTGIASGLWVLDVDPPDGEANIRRLEAEHGALPVTRTVMTPSGGRHLWFKYTRPVPLSVGKIATNIDVRGDGGYIVAPPSLFNGRVYAWSGDPQAPLAIAPDWLLDLARKRPTISERAVAAIKQRESFKNPRSPAYGRAALAAEISELAATPPGQRNHVLNRVSFRLHQLVGGHELNAAEVERQLIAACEKNGLVGDDGLPSVVKTIRSGARAGLQHPRSRNGNGGAA